MGNTRYKNRPVFASGTKQKNVKPDEKNRTIYLEKKIQDIGKRMIAE